MSGKVVPLRKEDEPKNLTMEYRGQTVYIEHRPAVNDFKYTCDVRRTVIVHREGHANTHQKAIDGARAQIDKVLGEEK